MYFAECFINKIHPSVKRGNRNTFWGSWLRDARPRSETEMKKRWVTEHFSGNLLLEFQTEEALRSGVASKTYELPVMFDGTDHVIYNGSLFYHRAGTDHIARYNMETGDFREHPMARAIARGDRYLYSESGNVHSLSYLDFATDENGLWVIYRMRGGQQIAVSNIHPENLQAKATWLLPRKQSENLGNIFIVCGVLYRVNSMTGSEAKVDWAYNLYTKRASKVNLDWRNLFGKSTMVNYNPVDQFLYVYDNGFLLTAALDIVEPN